MGLLAIGAGASEGLDQMLARMLSEQQLQRLKDAQTETARHNQADEALKGRQIDVMGQARGDALKAGAAAKDQAEKDKQAGMLAMRLAALPGGTPVDNTLKMRAVDSGAAVPEQFKFDPENMGMSTPEGEVGGHPSQQVWQGTAGNQLAQQKLTDAESKPNPADQTEAVYRQNPKTGAVERMGEVPKGAHFMTQPTPSPGHFTAVQTYGPDGKPGPVVRLNADTGEVKPVDVGGTIRPTPGAAQQATTDAHKKDALDTLAQLDQSIDAAKDLIGPGQGRVTSIEQMIGNADPRAQALGTKMLLGKMKIDAAIGGMRAAASPQILARWDSLLGNQVSYEGLKASVQALRELMGGANPGAGGGGKAPTAQELIDKYSR